MRLVLTDELRLLYDRSRGLSPPQIPDGAMVELDLFGEGAAEFYAYQIASYMAAEADLEEIDGLGESIDQILTAIEHGEADGRSAEEIQYWNEVATRMVALVCLGDSFTNVTDSQRRLLVLLLETALNGLLHRLRRCCIGEEQPGRHRGRWRVAPVTGRLDDVKTLLHEANRLVRELDVEIDPAIRDEIGIKPPDGRCTVPTATEWRPLCSEINLSGNADSLLSAMVFAAVDMGLAPATFEYGIFGSTVRALRGIKRERSAQN
jgi:hypothetical protein